MSPQSQSAGPGTPEPEQLALGFGRFNAQQFAPVGSVVKGARDYAASRGLMHSTEGLESTQVDPQRGFRVQAAYRRAQAAPGEVPGIRHSYEAMRGEVNAQYEHMTKPAEEGGMGLQHEVTKHDPYSSSHEMAWDVANRRIKTLSTEATGPHNFFSNEENDRFRAVHDVFGHVASGRGFSRHGEEAAFQSHAQMFTPAARPALASETRGQNSFLNFAPGAGGFPEQGTKLVGLPDWASNFNDRRRRPAGSGVFNASGQVPRR